jgi:hypothetical protein
MERKMTTEQKIEKLNREMKIHRLINLILFLSLLVIIGIAAKTPNIQSFDTMTVNQLIVREGVTFQEENGNNWGRIALEKGITPMTSIVFYAPNVKNKRFILGLDNNHSAIQLLSGEKDINAISISASDLQASVDVNSDKLHAQMWTHPNFLNDNDGMCEISLYKRDAKKIFDETGDDKYGNFPSLDSLASIYSRNIIKYLTLTNNPGRKDIETGGAIFIYNKEGIRVLDLYQDIYGNGRIGVWNKKGLGREITPE